MGKGCKHVYLIGNSYVGSKYDAGVVIKIERMVAVGEVTLFADLGSAACLSMVPVYMERLLGYNIGQGWFVVRRRHAGLDVVPVTISRQLVHIWGEFPVWQKVIVVLIRVGVG